MKKETGITLLALVITIIVLLILAGITIGAITGDDGIIQNALSAKEKTEIANEREIVEQATVQAMGKNKRGNLVRDELQEELDKLTGEGKTIVTTDTEEFGYFVKFLESGRIYKVSIDGDVEYLGKEDELITQADIIANPESNTTPELIQQVDLTVKTPIEIEGAEYSLVYAWNQDKENAPEDTKFLEANLIGEGRIRTTTVYSSDTVGGEYYLWVRIVVGEIEREACFGPYAIKDHTTLVAVGWNDGLATGGFLGNSEVPRGKIQNIKIVSSLEGHSIGDENTWDVTDSRNGMYLAWYEVNENGYYDVTIGGNGGIVANSNSLYLFKNIGYGVENQEVTITGLEYLDTGLVRKMGQMFNDCKAEKLDISKFDTNNVEDMGAMFAGCSNLKELDIENLKTEKVKSMTEMFKGCSKLTQLNVTNFNTSNVTEMADMFSNCTSITELNIQNFNTSKVTKMNGMFGNCSITSLDVSNFNTSNVTDMQGMFSGCKATSLDLTNFDTSNVTNMRIMFSGCKATSINLSSFNTSNVTNMERMFENCQATNLDLSSFNTSNVTNMYRMFIGCKAENIDVSNFDISNVTYTMEGMFRGCSNLVKLDASSFINPKTTSIDRMFGECKKIEEINLSNLELQEGTSVTQMFYYCQNLTKLDIRKLELTKTVGDNAFFMGLVPTSCEIIVKNEAEKQWFSEHHPTYTNIVIAN